MADASSQIWTPGDSPGSPPAGKYRFYVDSNGIPTIIDDSGNETPIGVSATQVQLFCAVSNVSHSYSDDTTTSVNWNLGITTASRFTHSVNTNNNEITVNTAGNIEYSSNVNIDNYSSKDMYLRTRLLKKSGTSWVPINYSTATGVAMDENDVPHFSIPCPPTIVPVQSGDILKVELYIEMTGGGWGSRSVSTASGKSQITLKHFPI